MSDPVLLIENHLSITQFGLHVLTPSEEATGTEAYRVADGRRSPLDRWTGVTLNVEYSLKWAMDRPRAADVIWCDRGYVCPRLILEYSDDNFATPAQAVFDITLPTASMPGSIDSAFGVRTEEGCWIKRFPVRTASYGRIRIPAMGAGLKPSIVGLMVGLSWTPGPLRRPFGPDRNALVVNETPTDSGWLGRGRAVKRREGSLGFMTTSECDYALGRYHIDHFDRGRPMVIVPNDEQAERSFVAVRQPPVHGLSREPSYYYEQGELPYVEWEPRRR